MSTIMRTLRNLRQIGLKEYGHQMQAGTLVGKDRYGNKYFENLEDLPLRTRWCDYKDQEFNPPPSSETGSSVGACRAPSLLDLEQKCIQTFQHNKYQPWTPVAAPRK
ncbi:unnamed protein product, partial [Aureobasidium pullulans]